MTTTCLFLKPQVTTAEGREKQRRDIETFIRPAIKQAGLTVLDDQVDGHVARDISDDLIQKIYEAEVLVVDANYYETTGFQLSPYLYYYIAMGNSLGNRTILVASATMHLPNSLIKHHTLTYSLEEIWQFIGNFKTVVEEIRSQQNSRPDNPIQDYLIQKSYAEAHKQIAAKEAEMEALKAQQKPGDSKSSPITFRKVK